MEHLMASPRAQRQRAIVDLLRESSPLSHEELSARLASVGHEVSRATVSQDLDQIGAVKVKRGVQLGYALPDQLAERDRSGPRLRRIFAEWVQAIETAGNLIVVRTPPGSAGLVCLALDQAKLPEIVGTIAGDDTLFIAVRSGLPVEPLAQRLRDFVEGA
jgi:transcriptional regulator of arginine metabolism